MKNKKEFLKFCTCFQERVSNPIQVIIFIIVISAIIGSIVSFKGCDNYYDFDNMEAFFIGGEAPLHDCYTITVLDKRVLESVKTKDEESSANMTEKMGNILSVTLSIKQTEGNKTHRLDQNDFKLKDHNGVKIPLSEILELIDVNSPDFHFSQTESVFSNDSFSTTTPIKDYSWLGKELQVGQEEIITIYFSMPKDINLEKTLMILEVDFYFGGGKTNTGTDIILYHRQKKS